jgi:cytochrome c oxidase subunit 2
VPVIGPRHAGDTRGGRRLRAIGLLPNVRAPGRRVIVRPLDRLPPALSPDTTFLPQRRRALAMAVLAALGGLLLSAGPVFADAFTPESGGSPNADDIDTLYKLIGILAIIVFVAVEGALIWAFFKFKARKGAVAAQVHGNTRLEIGWTVGAAVLLVFIVTVTFIMLPGIKNPAKTGANGLQLASDAVYASTDQPPPPGGKALRIKVDGQQYIWRYQYPGAGGKVFSYEEMVVPANTTVVLDITADDVIHSWWIPKLGGKMDAVPGYTNHTWFKARKGTYGGQCAELCGRNHANMLARVRVVSPDEYQAWYRGQAQRIKAAQAAQAKERKTYEPGQ